jgi:hypothetical protein
MTELPIPQNVRSDKKAIEILRVWISNNSQQVSLATDIWDDPAAWGIMLVDLARHVANAYEQTKGKNKISVLARIREGFDVEWESPTDDPKGSV